MAKRTHGGPLRWQACTLILSLMTPNAFAQAPRCDAVVSDFNKVSANWEVNPIPPGLDVGSDERQLILRCKTCTPSVAVSIRTTDLTQSKKGPAIDPSKGQSFEATFADPVQKKAFADWYNSDIQNLNPGCEVQTELRETKKAPSGLSYATLYLGAFCRGQSLQHKSGMEYIGGRDACGIRITLLWPGKEPLPKSSVDKIDELFGQLKLLP